MILFLSSIMCRLNVSMDWPLLLFAAVTYSKRCQQRDEWSRSTRSPSCQYQLTFSNIYKKHLSTVFNSIKNCDYKQIRN